MQKEETFTAFEGFSLLAIIFIFHVYLGSLQRMTGQCGNAAWIASLLSGVLAVGLLFLYYALFRMFPGRGLLQICHEIFGDFVSKVVALLLFLFFLLFGIVNLRESIQILTNNAYINTGSLYLAAAFIAVAFFIAGYPVKGLARITSVCIIITIASVVFILLMSYQQYEPAYLTPFFGHGAAPIACLSFTQLTCYDGILVAGVFLGSFASPKAYKKSGLWAVGISALVLLAISFLYCMSNPYQALKYNETGLLDLAKSIYVNRFFQRFESVFVIFVSMGKVLVLCLTLLALKKTFCFLVSMPGCHENTVLLPISLILLGCSEALYYKTLARNYLSDFMRSYSLAFTLGLLAIFLIGGWLRTRKKGGGGGGRRPVRALCLMLVCCMFSSLFSGCSNINEPDEEFFAIVMGYDKSDSETMRITVKVMPADEKSSGGESPNAEGNSKDNTPDNVFTVDAPCNIPAADLINTVIPKHLSMLHVKMLVISEELAREDLDILLTPFMRYNEVKSSISVVICRETAEEFISGKNSSLIPFLPMETEMIMKKNKGNSSYLVRSMGEIYRDYIGNYGDALVMYGGLTGTGKNKADEESSGDSKDGESSRSNGELGMVMGNLEGQAATTAPGGVEKQKSADVYYDDPDVGYLNGYYPGDIPIRTAVEPQIAGMAVLRGTQMVGALNTHETAMFMLGDGSFSTAVLPLRDPYIENYYVVFYARSRQNDKVKTNIDENGVAHIDVECFIHAELAIVHNSQVNYREPQQSELLRQYTEQYLQEEIQKVMDKLQNEYQSDAFRLGRYVARKFATIEEWEAYDWPSRYKDAEINFKVNVRL